MVGFCSSATTTLRFSALKSISRLPTANPAWQNSALLVPFHSSFNIYSQLLSPFLLGFIFAAFSLVPKYWIFAALCIPGFIFVMLHHYCHWLCLYPKSRTPLHNLPTCIIASRNLTLQNEETSKIIRPTKPPGTLPYTTLPPNTLYTTLVIVMHASPVVCHINPPPLHHPPSPPCPLVLILSVKRSIAITPNLLTRILFHLFGCTSC